MRRPVRSFVAVFLVIVLELLPSAAVAQDGAPDVYESEDGLMAVLVPRGAAPPGVDIRVERRDPSERPAELSDLPMTKPFYELQPSDTRFGEPITVERVIEFDSFGVGSFDPSRDGLVAGSLFTRDPDGVWSWIDDTRVQIDPSRQAFVVTGMTDHGGPLITLIDADLIVAADPPESAIGDPFRVEGLVRAEPASVTDISTVSGRTSKPDVATPRDSYEVEGIDGAVGLEFECLDVGTIDYEVVFTLTDVADASPLDEFIGLPGTDVDVTYAGEHTCA